MKSEERLVEANRSFVEKNYSSCVPVFTSLYHPNPLVRNLIQFINRREFYLHSFLRGEIKPGQKILDFGCGIGNWDFDLAKEFNVDVFGIDLSKKAIKIAKKNSCRYGRNVFFVVGDCCCLPFKRIFDAVVSRDVFGHLPFPNKAAAEINRVLKKNSVCALHSETSHYRDRWFYRAVIEQLKEDPWVNEVGHINLLTIKDLVKVFEGAEFVVEEKASPAQYLGFLLSPGSFYPGIKRVHPKKFSLLWFLKEYNAAVSRILESHPSKAKFFFALNAVAEFLETKLSKKPGGSVYFKLRKKNEFS